MPIIDLTGKKYHRLTVIGFAFTRKKHRYWSCRCKCGEEVIVDGGNLKSGHTQSCGCWNQEMTIKRNISNTKHGSCDSSEYQTWGAMKSRCLNPNDQAYADYGGRGITVCTEWVESFETFLDDMGPKPKQTCGIGRIDNNLGYEPNNCRWETWIQQNNNMRSNIFYEFNGQYLTLAQWSRIVGLRYDTLWCRVQRGWSIKKTLITPSGNYQRSK